MVKEKLRSIAFPTISTGVFNFPKKDACDIALKNVDLFLDKYGDFVDLVVFCLHSDSSVELYEKMILIKLIKFIFFRYFNENLKIIYT